MSAMPALHGFGRTTLVREDGTEVECASMVEAIRASAQTIPAPAPAMPGHLPHGARVHAAMLNLTPVVEIDLRVGGCRHVAWWDGTHVEVGGLGKAELVRGELLAESADLREESALLSAIVDVLEAIADEDAHIVPANLEAGWCRS